MRFIASVSGGQNSALPHLLAYTVLRTLLPRQFANMSAEKSRSVQQRFLCRIKIFNWFLKLNGVFLNPKGAAWRMSVVELWSCLGLLLNMISGVYIFKRFAISALVSVFAPRKGISQMTSFNAFLAHVTPILFGIPMQGAMFFTVRKTFESFLSILGTLDSELNQPSLPGSLKASALLRVLLIVSAVIIRPSHRAGRSVKIPLSTGRGSMQLHTGLGDFPSRETDVLAGCDSKDDKRRGEHSVLLASSGIVCRLRPAPLVLPRGGQAEVAQSPAGCIQIRDNSTNS